MNQRISTMKLPDKNDLDPHTILTYGTTISHLRTCLVGDTNNPFHDFAKTNLVDQSLKCFTRALTNDKSMRDEDVRFFWRRLFAEDEAFSHIAFARNELFHSKPLARSRAIKCQTALKFIRETFVKEICRLPGAIIMEVCGWCGALALGGECTNLHCKPARENRAKAQVKRQQKKKSTKPKSREKLSGKFNRHIQSNGAVLVPGNIHLQREDSLPKFFGYATDKKSTPELTRAALLRLFEADLQISSST